MTPVLSPSSTGAAKPNCLTCMFFEDMPAGVAAQNVKSKVGFCKRFPPVTISMPVRPGQNMISTSPPVVGEGNHCFEHKLLVRLEMGALT